MNNLKIKIKEIISSKHDFSKDLDGGDSITKLYLEESLANFNPTDIHVALIELMEEGYIDYNQNSGIIIINNL